MARAFLLSESDRQAIQALLTEYRSRPRTRQGIARTDWDDTVTPEVYVALSPEDGIPGVTDAGGAIPGSADVEVYRLLGGTLTDAGFTRHVFNPSVAAVDSDQWILICRDKFGQWYVCQSYDTEGTGTGTGTAPSPPPGKCSLAALRDTDCLFATGLGQSVLLRPGGGTWSSDDPTCPGTAGEVFFYPGGSGVVLFWFEAGDIHLSINGLELLNCGNGCFAGGPLTGHAVPVPPGTTPKPCTGTTFLVCVECVCCSIPGWCGPAFYCIKRDEATGTGSPSLDCVAVELLEEDRCDGEIVICSGPYDTLDEAELHCPPPPSPAGPVVCFSLVGATKDIVISNRTGDCASASCPFTPFPSGSPDYAYAPYEVAWNVTCEGSFAIAMSCDPSGNFECYATINATVAGTANATTYATLAGYTVAGQVHTFDWDFSFSAGEACQITGATGSGGFRATITITLP